MSLETQISLITAPQEFARLCNAVLRAEHGADFLPIDDDQADAGNDGYLKSERRMYAMHCFKRAQNQSVEQLVRRKAVGDLGKAIALKRAGLWEVDAWTFLSNYPISARVAAEVVRLGREAGIDVSWAGPAEIAASIQRHADVAELFPTLQVNEVSGRLGALHERVSQLARDLKPSGEERFTGVPSTPEEQTRLIASRPDGWEHLLFAGALRQGVEALEFAYLDFKIGMGAASERVDFDTALRVFDEADEQVIAAVRALGRVFTDEVQAHALGPPGVEGDVRAIQHLAHVVVDAYGDFLAAGNRIAALDPPRLLAAARRLTLRRLANTIETTRDFVLTAAEELKRLAERAGCDETTRPDAPKATELLLDLTPDPDLDREIDAEWSRVRRKVRWRRWTGVDVEAH